MTDAEIRVKLIETMEQFSRGTYTKGGYTAADVHDVLWTLAAGVYNEHLDNRRAEELARRARREGS